MAICTVCSRLTSKKCAKCGLAWYCGTECQKSDRRNHKLICKYPIEIKESEGKGLGLFATRDLEIGDLIVCENPILHLKSGNERILQCPQEFKLIYEKLNREEKDQVLALTGIERESETSPMERFLDSFSGNEEWYL